MAEIKRKKWVCNRVFSAVSNLDNCYTLLFRFGIIHWLSYCTVRTCKKELRWQSTENIQYIAPPTFQDKKTTTKKTTPPKKTPKKQKQRNMSVNNLLDCVFDN